MHKIRVFFCITVKGTICILEAALLVESALRHQTTLLLKRIVHTRGSGDTDLKRRALCGERREADDVTEVYRHGVVRLRYHRMALDQLAGHRPESEEIPSQNESIEDIC